MYQQLGPAGVVDDPRRQRIPEADRRRDVQAKVTRIAFKRVYPCCGTQGDVALWIIGVDGTHAERLSSTRELYNNLGGDDAFWNTAWAPDGRQLAYLADGVGGAYDVYVVNDDGTDGQNISASPEEEYWPSWSPDGSRIAFPRMASSRPRAGFSSRSTTPAESHQGTFVVVSPDGSNPVPLTGPPVDSETPVWSPDGTRLLGYVFNPDLLNERTIAVFDPSGREPTTTVPANGLNSASWQRLAP